MENRARGYKTFFMLNSVEHEILNAHKCRNIKKFGSDKPRMLFFLLINIYEQEKFHAQLSMKNVLLPRSLIHKQWSKF